MKMQKKKKNTPPRNSTVQRKIFGRNSNLGVFLDVVKNPSDPPKNTVRVPVSIWDGLPEPSNFEALIHTNVTHHHHVTWPKRYLPGWKNIRLTTVFFHQPNPQGGLTYNQVAHTFAENFQRCFAQTVRIPNSMEALPPCWSHRFCQQTLPK